MPVISGGGGAGGPAAGSYLPVADKTSVTVDSTTYDNTVTGSGKLTTLVFPVGIGNGTGVLAFALAGDVFPRFILISDPTDVAVVMGDGTFDPFQSGGAGFGTFGHSLQVYAGAGAELKLSRPAVTSTGAPKIDQLSPKFTITSGALPTVQLVTATGAQILTTRDAETVTPFTGDGTNNVASCAIAISPDNVTYSTVATISIAAALNLTGVLTDTVNARVPAGWYFKLTVSHGTLGLTSYY